MNLDRNIFLMNWILILSNQPVIKIIDLNWLNSFSGQVGYLQRVEEAGIADIFIISDLDIDKYGECSSFP